MTAGPTRDIIVMGASIGGVDAYRKIVRALPKDLPAAVFLVIHRPGSHDSLLADILRPLTGLRVDDALHGERIEHGRVYVAPPDNHLLVRAGRVEVVHGARENGHRPAVNSLFRSAAAAYGPRVIGVVLTGSLDCGTFGLLAIKARGGLGIAQDPATAASRDMPASAIRSGAVDHVVALDELAPLLTTLAQERSTGEMATPPEQDLRKHYSFITCPSCHGSMTETGSASLTEFACHVGHTFSLRSLYAEQADQVESALWAGVRALEESAGLAQRLSETASGSLKARFLERQRAMQLHSEILRQMILGGSLSTRSDLPTNPE